MRSGSPTSLTLVLLGLPFMGCTRAKDALPADRVLVEHARGSVRVDAAAITLDGATVHFPTLDTFDRTRRPPRLTVSIDGLDAWGRRQVVLYRSPGCGERLALDTGVATLGCPAPADRPPALRDVAVDLTLDTEAEDQTVSRTRIELADGPVVAQLLVGAAAGASPALELLSTAAGTHLRYRVSSRATVDTHRIELELEDGELVLDTHQEGGGAFRVGEEVAARLTGAVRYRNGQLLFAMNGRDWQASVDPELHTNGGVDLHLTAMTGGEALAWTEVDGRFRKTADRALQARLDAVAPDPAAPRGSLGADLERMAELAFKEVAHSVRPTGPIRELERKTEPVGDGAELVRLKLKRDPAPGESDAPRTSQLTVAVLFLDLERFHLGLTYPCDFSKAGFAVLNGYTFSDATGVGQRLPDAGLIVDHAVIGRVRTDPWYTNLTIDEGGIPAFQSADRFFARGALPATTRHLIQGTAYVRAGQSVRAPGDNAEINWRSAVGVRHYDGRPQVVFAHTLVPTTPLVAAATWGDGLQQWEMAKLLLDFGVEDALILDGGPGAAMRVGTRLISGTLRPTPVCIVADPVLPAP